MGRFAKTCAAAGLVGVTLLGSAGAASAEVATPARASFPVTAASYQFIPGFGGAIPDFGNMFQTEMGMMVGMARPFFDMAHGNVNTTFGAGDSMLGMFNNLGKLMR